MERLKKALFSTHVGKAEWIAVIAYPLLLLFLTQFHEFHFDEVQAWQIAKSASIRDILFQVEHYEGHPPLWHLLLAIFAKAGLPFQVMLPLLNIMFSTMAMAVLLFRSPFPKAIRCTLPFSYYLFYQYGVISRPYSLLMLALMLSAANNRERNKHPWKYILSLCLLCLSSAYGILIAGIFCLIWTFEILAEIRQNRSWGSFLRSSRFFSLLLILLLAVGLVLTIWPAEDCYFNGKLTDPSIWEKAASFTYWEAWLALPFDIWFGQLLGLDSGILTTSGMLTEAVFGLAILIFTGYFMHYNKLLLKGLVPYLLVSLFMIFGYSSPHHMGILALLHIQAVWMALEEHVKIPPIIQNCRKRLNLPYKNGIFAFSLLIGCIPPGFSLIAGIHEIQLPYSPVKMQQIIAENHLETKKIMTSWLVVYEEKDGHLITGLGFPWPTHEIPGSHPEIRYHLTDIDGLDTLLCAYAGKNYFMNYNTSCPDDLYMHYRWNAELSQIDLATWKQKGLPDFIIGYAPLESIYDDEMQDVRYVSIAAVKHYSIFKATYQENTNYLFIREDLLPEYPQFQKLFY